VSSSPRLVIPAVLAGIALLVVAVLYFADSAADLPSFLPGHETGSAHHHIKHGIAALIVGLGAFIFAWFQTGPAGRPSSP
jgi:uncharacterized RDD family membrane protein YckC